MTILGLFLQHQNQRHEGPLVLWQSIASLFPLYLITLSTGKRNVKKCIRSTSSENWIVVTNMHTLPSAFKLNLIFANVSYPVLTPNNWYVLQNFLPKTKGMAELSKALSIIATKVPQVVWSLANLIKHSMIVNYDSRVVVKVILQSVGL